MNNKYLHLAIVIAALSFLYFKFYRKETPPPAPPPSVRIVEPPPAPLVDTEFLIVNKVMIPGKIINTNEKSRFDGRTIQKNIPPVHYLVIRGTATGKENEIEVGHIVFNGVRIGERYSAEQIRKMGN